MTPGGRANKRTLIRRATFDLTGLPPTPEAVECFFRDNSVDAIREGSWIGCLHRRLMVCGMPGIGSI